MPDTFLIGYGLDLKGRYRNVPYLGVMKPDILEIEAE
jgi:hypoxanthine phosphoribosyltransferase